MKFIYSSSGFVFSRQYEAISKEKEQKFPLYLIGGALRILFVAVGWKVFGYFLALEKAVRAQQLSYIPNHLDCKCKRGSVLHITFKVRVFTCKQGSSKQPLKHQPDEAYQFIGLVLQHFVGTPSSLPSISTIVTGSTFEATQHRRQK